jgi:hypothetical protein
MKNRLKVGDTVTYKVLNTVHTGVIMPFAGFLLKIKSESPGGGIHYMNRDQVKRKEEDMDTQKVEKWSKDATKAFKGKTVRRITWITEEEVKELGWSGRAPIIEFTDGSHVLASSDDEGNAPGALWTSEKGALSILPVI